MNSLKLKRQTFAKQIRRQQRNQIFSANRDKSLKQYDPDQSLQTMIFFIIESLDDKSQTNQQGSQHCFHQNDFQDFLDALSAQFQQEADQQKQITLQLKETILQKYLAEQTQFCDKVLQNSEDSLDKIMLIEDKKHKKLFFLLRLLIRLKYIGTKQLFVIDNLLKYCHQRIQKIFNKLSMQIRQNKHEKSKNSPLNNDCYSDLFKDIQISLELNLKLLKEIVFMRVFIKQNSLKTQLRQQEKIKGQLEAFKLKKIRNQVQLDIISNKFKHFQISKENLLYIEQLTQKWLINTLFLPMLMDKNFIQFMKQSLNSYFYQKIKSFSDRFNHLYFYLHQQQDFIGILFKPQNIIQNKSKIIQLFYNILSSCIYTNKQIQIKEFAQDIDKIQLFLFLSVKTIKLLQSYLQPDSHSEIPRMDNNLTVIYSKLLDCMIDLTIQGRPIEVMTRLSQAFSQISSQSHESSSNLNQLQKIGKQSIRILFNSNCLQKQSLILKSIKLITSLEYPDLINLLDLLSILSSYSDKLIQLIFGMPQFQVNFGEKYTFSTLIKKCLLNHISVQVRLRSYWLLMNVAGSQLHYKFELQFIQYFFRQKKLYRDLESRNLSKQELLIQQSIMQIIMRYLSNIKTYLQIWDLSQFQSNNNDLIKNNDLDSDHKQLLNFRQEQNLLEWIMNQYAQTIRNISNDFKICQGQNFIEILVYSLFNMLSIQKQNSQNRQQNVIIQKIEGLQIIKNLQSIYSKFTQQQQNLRIFSMIERLLDFISDYNKK